MADQFSVKKILNGLEGRLGEDDYIEPLEILISSLNKNKLNKFGELAFKIRYLLSVFQDLGLHFYSISYIKINHLDLLFIGKS
jgi:hypothetical protein